MESSIDTVDHETHSQTYSSNERYLEENLDYLRNQRQRLLLLRESRLGVMYRELDMSLGQWKDHSAQLAVCLETFSLSSHSLFQIRKLKDSVQFGFLLVSFMLMYSSIFITSNES